MTQVKVMVLNKEIGFDLALARALGVFIFIALTTAGAYIRIPLPFTPVPITLQTFFVLLAGAVLGKKLGSISQAGYLMFGIFGLPVFTGGLYGLARLFGPTGGYLIGFVLAAYMIGKLLDSDSNAGFIKITLVMLLGDIILLSSGAAYLSIIMHIPLQTAFLIGFMPFVIGDIIKLLAAATVYQKMQKTSRALFE